MLNLLSLIGIFALVSSIKASFNGPFVLWGRDELSRTKVNSLSEIDDKFLRDIYSDSSAIILFVRNASSHLTEENFPIFKDLLSKTSYAYLTQQHLGIDPMEFNLNAEVINLVGPTSQQDVELSALYRDAVITYGDGKVLGVLATKASDHELRKRAAGSGDEIPSQETPTVPAAVPTTPEQEPGNQTEFVYYPSDPISSKYKILMYTSAPPRLFDGLNSTFLNDSLTTTITTNRVAASDQAMLKIQYNYKKGKLAVEYTFNVSGDYWTLISVDIDGGKQESGAKAGNVNKTTLYLAGDRPAAPMEFSYKCSRPLVFGTNNYYLELADIQVQLDVGARRFNDSYDCIGFTSAPIWSGVFISFIICFSVALGLNFIMEIKPPNRFENSRGKQLTFTISE